MFFGVHVLAIIIWQGMAHFRSGFETARCHILPIFFIDISILYTHRTMYGIFTYLYHKNQPHVGKYTIHGWFGTYLYLIHVPFCGIYRILCISYPIHAAHPRWGTCWGRCYHHASCWSGSNLCFPCSRGQSTCRLSTTFRWFFKSQNIEYKNINHFLMETFLENAIILCNADTSQSLCCEGLFSYFLSPCFPESTIHCSIGTNIATTELFGQNVSWTPLSKIILKFTLISFL